MSLTALQRRGLPARRPALSALSRLADRRDPCAPLYLASLVRDARGPRLDSRVCARGQHLRKGGVTLDTPGPAGGLALLAALFRAALFRSLLRHDSSLELGSSAE